MLDCLDKTLFALVPFDGVLDDFEEFGEVLLLLLLLNILLGNLAHFEVGLVKEQVLGE